jgi:hypothetical protein
VRRFVLTHLLPAALLAGIVVVPLATGARTLILRDTLITHLAMREGLARTLRDGEIAIVDPLRAGGQALLGNLNAVALYPDNLLLFVGSTLWQLNAHFWIHWIVAFAAAFWLARTTGLGRPAAAMTGAAYAFGGFFVSQLNLYNAVAPAALAPALAAAALELTGEAPRRRRGFVALALLWALSLLGGDPVLAALAILVALALALAGKPAALPDPRPSRARAALWSGGALLVGSALAAPQLLATKALLADSSRGFRGFEARDMLVASPGPGALLELLLPLFFGRPDSGAFWGNAYFGGTPPLYFSLAPGAIVLALAAVAIRCGGRERRAPLALAISGLALTFSSGTFVSTLLAALPGMGLVRFQAKFALLFALGSALLAGLGAERLASGDATARHRAARALRGALAVLVGLYGAIFLFFALRPAALVAGFLEAFGSGLPAAAAGFELRRWTGLALLSVAGLAVARVAAARRFERVALFVAVAIALQAGHQLLLLNGILPTDDASFYRVPPAAIAALPTGSRTVHGADHQLFGAELMKVPAADGRLAAQVRRAWSSGFGFAAHAGGRMTELDVSPEGLDPFTVAAAGDAMKALDDARRIRLLRATGVTHLLLPRLLDGVPDDAARLVSTDGSIAPPLSTYEIVDPLPAATVATCVRRAPHMNAALAALTGDGFDARREAVVPGSGPDRCDERAGGVARLVVDERERVEVEVEAPRGGVLVLARADSPVWRVEVDGERAEAVPAQMTRLAAVLPPGARRVVFRADRAPLHVGIVLAIAAGIALPLLSWRLSRGSRVRPAGASAGPVSRSAGVPLC